jgi:hypothetical protein
MNLKDKICVLLIVLFAFSAKAQYYKEKISIVLFTADFVEPVSLKDYRKHNTYVFNYENSKHEKFFLNESVDFLPTLIVYNNGKVIYKAEAGIDLQLPEGYKINVTQTIDELIENKF